MKLDTYAQARTDMALAQRRSGQAYSFQAYGYTIEIAPVGDGSGDWRARLIEPGKLSPAPSAVRATAELAEYAILNHAHVSKHGRN